MDVKALHNMIEPLLEAQPSPLDPESYRLLHGLRARIERYSYSTPVKVRLALKDVDPPITSVDELYPLAADELIEGDDEGKTVVAIPVALINGIVYIG